MKTCSYCGRENPDEATQCRECGTGEFVVPGAATAPTLQKAPAIAEPAEPEPHLSPDGASALCTYCLFPNLPEAPWCKRCGASMTYASIVGPVDAAEVSGFMWRGALRGHPKPFVFVAIWILFFPSLLLNLLMAFASLMGRFGGGLGFVLFWHAVAFAAVAYVMLYRVTRNFLAVPEQP